MTTEYYQIPSQQALLPLPISSLTLPLSLPLDSSDSDPWLAAATSSLSLADAWSGKGSVKGKVQNTTTTLPPSLFEPGDADAVAWKHVMSKPTSSSSSLSLSIPSTPPPEVKAPKTPKQFNSTASKIDAWSVVVDTSVLVKQQQQQQKKQQQPQPQQQPQQVQLQVQQPVQQQVQQVQQPAPSPSSASPSLVVADADESKVTIEDELAHQNRYKTELCKSFTETGNCRYGVKCQFAHGKEEIRHILRHPKYKTEICKTFHTTGTCPYGIRCRFIHTKSKEESISLTSVLISAKTNVTPNTSPIANANGVAKVKAARVEHESDEEDASITSPPGLSAPQWSKSWNVSIAPMSSMNIRISDLAEPEPAF